MSSSQSNKPGQIYVEWDIKTQILRYVSACSVARNSCCPNSTLCSVSLLVKSPDNQTPYKLKETNTPSSSGLLHAGFSPPLLLTEQGGGTSVLRSRTAEGGRAGEICSPTLSIFFQSTPTSEGRCSQKC